MTNCETGCTIRAEHLATCEGECWGCLPVHTDWKVCHFCFERFGKNLTRIGQSWNDLQKQITKPTSYAFKDRVSGTNEVGLVVNEQVMDLMAEVRDWLLFVSRIVMTENSGALQSSDTLELIKLLERHIGFLTMHELAADFVADARRFASKVERTAYPSGERRIKIRQTVCQREIPGGICGGQLSYWMRDGQSPQKVTCSQNPAHEIAAFEMNSMQWVRADEIAIILQKPITTVYVLAHRNHWPTTKTGRIKLYSRTAVQKYLEANA